MKLEAGDAAEGGDVLVLLADGLAQQLHLDAAGFLGELGLLNTYLALILPFDLLTGFNYGYVGPAKPLNASLLDWLGPWPWRIGAMMAFPPAMVPNRPTIARQAAKDLRPLREKARDARLKSVDLLAADRIDRGGAGDAVVRSEQRDVLEPDAAVARAARDAGLDRP